MLVLNLTKLKSYIHWFSCEARGRSQDHTAAVQTAVRHRPHSRSAEQEGPDVQLGAKLMPRTQSQAGQNKTAFPTSKEKQDLCKHCKPPSRNRLRMQFR